jgi:internalin A
MTSRTNTKMKMWEDLLLRPYLGAVKRKCGVVETLALPSLRDLPAIQIETLFVPPLLCETPVHADDNPEDWPQGKTLLTELQASKQLVVLGDPGGGKTTLSNWLAWRLASGASAPLPSVVQDKIPLPCILREMPSSCFEPGFSVVDLAIAVVRKLIGDYKALEMSSTITHWVTRGDYVLILDGIDEVPVARRHFIASWIKEVHRQDAVVLATSRIVGYEDYAVDSENPSPEQGVLELPLKLDSLGMGVLKRALSIRNSVSGHGSNASRGKQWAKLRYLMPFDKTQISDFARNWYSQRCVSEYEAKQRTSDLLISLAQSEITEKLARTPNLLSLMAIVHRERAHLPDGKALLYDEIVNAYLNTIDTHRQIGDDGSLARFGWKEKKAWLAYVGFKLQESREWSSSSTGIIASGEQVLGWLDEAIEESGVEDHVLVARDFLGWVARRSGLLLPRGENRYAFVHLSFQEYFCAYYLAGCIVKPAFIRDALHPDALVTRTAVADWGQNPAWLETYIFLFESVSAEYGFDWVETLIEVVFNKNGGLSPSLAARLVKNKHVKLPSEVRDFLADGCVLAIFNEVDFKRNPDSEIFRNLFEEGYALCISGNDNVLSSQEWERKSFSKIRVLVGNNGASFDARFLSKFDGLLALSVIDGSVDLAGLVAHPRLNYLRLSDANISSFEHIALHKKIRFLELRRLDLLDIVPLASLKDIKVLELAELPIQDLTPLSSMRRLTYLEISGLNVYDLSPLSSLKKLDAINMRGLPATSVDFIAALKFLTTIQVSHMSLGSFAPFADCKKLDGVDFSHMDFVDLLPLTRLRNLEGVFMSEVKNCDITPLGGIKRLSMVMLEDMSVESLSVLSRCPHLSNLFLTRVDLVDVNSLKSLGRLRGLVMRQMKGLINVEFLKDFNELNYLDLSGTDVGEIKFLSQMQVPFTLRLSENHKYDLGSLVSKDGFDIKVQGIDYED